MKRKADTINGSEVNEQPLTKKRSFKEPSPKSPKTPKAEDVCSNFRKGLFDKEVLAEYVAQHAKSEPYKHAVIHDLIDDTLLRNVRNEIRENVVFTPKETDIYRIHQSGDLANLDGLDDAALSKLPSLLKLRNSLYSKKFRDYVAAVTDLEKGGLSGKKTDMAINIYVPGCYLLCHDDVIGSRRISYILYLTDPDMPWKAEWGGALRLFPTVDAGAGGEKSYTPKPDTTKSIPPAWNQLSFFVVQPGESFHDVEEVFHAESKEALEKDGGRIRMAISGWFHIPQEGEEGYIEDLEVQLNSKSGLAQLQGRTSEYDFPAERKTIIDRTSGPQDLEDKDFEFLLKYMAPAYLAPFTMGSVTEHFGVACSITLQGILSNKFAARLKYEIERQDAKAVPRDTEAIENGPSGWKVARPPHKHRFMYKHPSSTDEPAGDEEDGKKGKEEAQVESETPALNELVNVFLPSRQFRQWLELATECEIEDSEIMARRFRRGQDYALATSHEGKSTLEFSLGLTPSPGWIIDEDENEADAEEVEEEEAGGEDEGDSKKDTLEPTLSSALKSSPSSDKEQDKSAEGKSKASKKPSPPPLKDTPAELGGQEVYMAADDSSNDAAVYKSSTTDQEEESPVLFEVHPSWNTLSLVLRDRDTLRFVKLVSGCAKGDRWDVVGVMGVGADEEDEEYDWVERSEGEGEEDDKGESQETVVTLDDLPSDEEDTTFKGFPDSDSESD